MGGTHRPTPVLRYWDAPGAHGVGAKVAEHSRAAPSAPLGGRWRGGGGAGRQETQMQRTARFDKKMMFVGEKKGGVGNETRRYCRGNAKLHMIQPGHCERRVQLLCTIPVPFFCDRDPGRTKTKTRYVCYDTVAMAKELHSEPHPLKYKLSLSLRTHHLLPSI